MKPYEVIQALQATSSKLEKEQIVRDAFLSGCYDFFRGARLAYDALVTFGVKKAPKLDEADDAVSTVTYTDFVILADQLRQRQLTGHAARDAIDDFLQRCSVVEWNDFYRRVLLKDLKVGASESTINKALKSLVKDHPTASEFIIPVFSVQLAPSESYNRQTISKLRGNVLVDIKYDGMRLSTTLDKEADEVIQYSRTGLVNESFPHVREALKRLMHKLPASCMIDGEIVGSSFNALMRKATKAGADTTDTTLIIFDIVPLDDFRAKFSPKTQLERHEVLVALKESGVVDECAPGGELYILPKTPLNLDTEEGQKALFDLFEEVMRLREKDKKFEGLITKKPDAGYKCKRWNAWEKVKPYVDASLEVVGFEEGKPDTKNAGGLGALICRGQDGDMMIEVRVGSGFTDAERKAWWANPELVMGFIAEVEAHEFSQDESKEGTNMWSMRHPRLKGWRGGKPGEKM
jgi:DNA ligase-1